MQSTETRAFPVALNLRGRAALVIGGGGEAAQKVPKLLRAGAHVTVVAPDVTDDLVRLSHQRQIVWFARQFQALDLLGVHLVLLTEPDPAQAQALRALAPKGRFWLGAVDQPEYSDFFLVSTLERGPVQIAISTSGRAPLLARRLRQALDRALDSQFSEFARSFAALRARLRGLPRAERSELLEQALEGFAMEVRLSYPEQDGQGASSPPTESRDD